ncbi:endospore germination permease [Paenibacillus chondroitinus]|uniref:Endospore germination permease n=1 Tax=Paenibacillus chondroitinus TaxID=59842 RepID=A0ABU6DAR8_9BACL|nr:MULTISPECIES: endospore germination permease [Paenibacillus]MCY9659805.1 spore germination protein [Paenibacillus anseongense]MEB4794016.1 endospore germination permease [Paenibacillus chondroitinus]
MSDMVLTTRQLFWMMVSTQVIMTILLTTAPAIQLANQDAWMSLIVSTAVAVGIAYICGKLASIFPDKTLIEFNRILLGKWFGGVISVMYLLVWIVILTVILKQFSLFITGTIMPRTPVFLIQIPMFLVVIYPTVHGVGVIARICELTGPIILIGVIGPMFLAINQLDWDRLLPIYIDNGLLALMKGSLPAAAFLGDCIMLLILIAFVVQKKQIVRHAVGGVMLSGVVTLISVIFSILMFGHNVAANYTYPMLMIVRSISIGGIIENLDAIVVTIWIMSVFTKLSLYLFVSSYGTSQLFGLKDWRKMTWVISAIVMLATFIPVNYEEISVIFPLKVAAPYIFPIFMVAGPLLLLLLALVKRKKLRMQPNA